MILKTDIESVAFLTNDSQGLNKNLNITFTLLPIGYLKITTEFSF